MKRPDSRDSAGECGPGQATPGHYRQANGRFGPRCPTTRHPFSGRRRVRGSMPVVLGSATITGGMHEIVRRIRIAILFAGGILAAVALAATYRHAGAQHSLPAAVLRAVVEPTLISSGSLARRRFDVHAARQPRVRRLARRSAAAARGRRSGAGARHRRRGQGPPFARSAITVRRTAPSLSIRNATK